MQVGTPRRSSAGLSGWPRPPPCPHSRPLCSQTPGPEAGLAALPLPQALCREVPLPGAWIKPRILPTAPALVAPSPFVPSADQWEDAHVKTDVM